MKLTNISLILFLIVIPYSLFADEKGSLLVRNFSPTEYEGGSKIYSVASTTNGLMYAGDKNGIIEFDGESWQKIQTGFPINSLAVSHKDKVFVAGKEGIGYLQRDSLNQIEYHSLNHLVTNHINSNAFRKSEVFQINDETLFVVDNKLVVYSDKRIRIIENNNSYRIAQKVDDELFLYSPKSGLYKYSDGEVNDVATSDEMKNRHIWGFTSGSKGVVIWERSGDSYQIEDNKLLVVENELNGVLKDYIVDGIQQIDSNVYVFKTFYKGLLLVSSDREIIKNINQKGGLINNTVFGVNLDAYGNLWVGTSAGISVLRQDLPFTIYNSQSGLGTGYSAVKIKQEVYLGTSHGLWRKNLDNKNENDFESLLPGHVFGLTAIDDVLYVGHPSGIYLIDDQRMKPVIHKPGGAIIKEVPFEEDIYITSSTNGLIVLKKQNGILKPSGFLKGKNREIHNFEFDSLGNVWVEYDNGIYSFNWDKPEKKRFHTRVGKENRIKKIRNINNELYFIADSGVYFYNRELKEFYAPNLLKGINSKNKNVSNIVSENSDDIWVYAGEQLKHYQIKNNTFYQTRNQPFKFIDGTYPIGFENVFHINDSAYLIGCEEGFYYYEEKKYNTGTYSSVIFRNINISSRSKGGRNIWGDISDSRNSYSLDIKEPIAFVDNSIEFIFAAGAPNYNRAYYQTHLYGYSEKWSEWSRDNSREFTNLPAGDYRFVVRAINDAEEYSKIAVCEFTILPPWYLTRLMKIVYVVLFLLILFSVFIVVHYAIDKAKSKLIKQQKEEAERVKQQLTQDKLTSEKELIRLRNEKLRSDNLHKAKELANLTFNLIQKNQVLTDFKGDLEQIKKYSETNKLVTEDIRRLIKKVNRDIDKEENWEVFEDYFDTVHENFFIKLKKKYPNLTSKDLRLCAYLRMNLATKEIAPLMNITVRGVEIGRYRLRRKLELDRNINFTSFLNSL